MEAIVENTNLCLNVTTLHLQIHLCIIALLPGVPAGHRGNSYISSMRLANVYDIMHQVQHLTFLSIVVYKS